MSNEADAGRFSKPFFAVTDDVTYDILAYSYNYLYLILNLTKLDHGIFVFSDSNNDFYSPSNDHFGLCVHHCVYVVNFYLEKT